MKIGNLIWGFTSSHSYFFLVELFICGLNVSFTPNLKVPTQLLKILAIIKEICLKSSVYHSYKTYIWRTSEYPSSFRPLLRSLAVWFCGLEYELAKNCCNLDKLSYFYTSLQRWNSGSAVTRASFWSIQNLLIKFLQILIGFNNKYQGGMGV